MLVSIINLIWSGNAYKKTNDKVGGIANTDVLKEKLHTFIKIF